MEASSAKGCLTKLLSWLVSLESCELLHLVSISLSSIRHGFNRSLPIAVL